MKTLLIWLVLFLGILASQAQPVLRASPFGREFIKAVDAAAMRALLEVSGGGGAGTGDVIAGNTLTAGLPLVGAGATFIVATNAAAYRAIVGLGSGDTPTFTGLNLSTLAGMNHTHQNSAGGGTLAEAALALTDITTGNATTSRHGFVPKLSNVAGEYYNGIGGWSVPAGVANDSAFGVGYNGNGTASVSQNAFYDYELLSDTDGDGLPNKLDMGAGMVKTDSGGVVSAASAGTDFVAPGAFTGSGLTLATARLLGRTTAATGAAEEISVGSRLTLASGSLSADSQVSDTAFSAAFDAVTTLSLSKNVFYDYVHVADTDDDGVPNRVDMATGIAFVDGSGGLAPLTVGTGLDLTGSTLTATGGGGGSTDNTAFGAGWNGATTVSPSQNAAYDYAHLADTDDDGLPNKLDMGAGLVKTDAGGVVSAASAGTDVVVPGAITSSGLTMATARLLGRTTAATGAPEEISIGARLSMAAGSLAATLQVDDTAWASSQNGVTTTAPTWNAIYDWGHSFDTDDDGKPNVLDLVSAIPIVDANGVISAAVAGTDYVAPDSDLTALAGASSTGLWTRTGTGAGTTRTITAGTGGVGVSNGDGVSGNPTISISAVPNASLANSSITIAGTANQVIVSGGGPVSLGGTATLSLPQSIGTGSSPTFAGLTVSGLTTGRAVIAGSSSTVVHSAIGAVWPMSIKPTQLSAPVTARPDATENNYKVLFAQNDLAYWQSVAPPNYNGNLKVRLFWSMASATSGSVVWSIRVWAVTAGDSADINTQSFDTANTASTAVPSTAGYLGTCTITCSNADGMVADDWVQFEIKRTDAVSGDAELTGISISYDLQ